jgi:hypothetical protein
VTFASTGDDGAYTTPPLRSGTYRVRFDGPWWLGFGTRYYNNKPDLASADVVAVTAPNNTPDIDATLAAVKRVAIPLARK